MEVQKKYIEDALKKIVHKKMRDLKKKPIAECDFILFFCFIVSRAGSDISAAVDEFTRLHGSKPAVLVVFHHTFEPEKVLPNSNAVVNRPEIFAIDCLYNEDAGLMKCQRNEDAVNKIAENLKKRRLTSYSCLEDEVEENLSLLPSGESWWQKFLHDWKFWLVIVLFLITVFVLVLYFCLKYL